MPKTKKKKGGGKKAKGEGGKKKAAAAAVAVEEVTLEELQSAFKKECKALNVSSSAAEPISNAFASYLDDEEKGQMSQLCVSGQQIDGLAVQALFASLQKSKYLKLKTLCFWRAADIGTDGVKAACDIVSKLPSIQKLEMRDCGLSKLGCELLGQSMLINNRIFKSLVTLRLDFNRFGSDGLLAIAKGFTNNRCLRRLSFAFCGVCGDKKGQDAIHRILSNCLLIEELNLENNALGTQGCIGLITGFSNLRSSAFKEVNISSNQIGEALEEGDVQILHALAQSFKACTTLRKISFDGNFFADKIADLFLMMLSEAPHIQKFTVPHTLPSETVAAFAKTVNSHKPKTTKKGKNRRKKNET